MFRRGACGVHRGANRTLMSVTGHELPRHIDERAAEIPPKAVAPSRDRRGRDGPITRLMHRSKFGELCRPFDAHVDFAAERFEVDRLGQQRLSAVLQCLTLCLRIAVRGDHDDRNVWPRRLRLG